MKRIPLLLLAAASLLVGWRATAATRPLYGGTLLVETSAQLASLDPAKPPADPAGRALAEKLFFLVGDRLVRLDERGHPHPSLATAWKMGAKGRSWTFTLREGVKFQDGKPLAAEDVVESLAALHPDWHLGVRDARVEIGLPEPAPELPLQLALAENSILRAGENGILIGSGPFRLTEFTPARITLAANETDWRGRPFLNGVQILLGHAPREQWIDLELGRADVVEIAPDEVRRALQSQVRLWTSQPEEVVALAFEPGRAEAGDGRVRQALASGVNRAALRNVLLQKQGEVAQSILPQWLSGYAFLFPAAPAAPSTAPAGSWPPLMLSYDGSDALLTSFAGRIAVDARAAGLNVRLQPQGAGAAAPADVRLVRERIESLDPRTALERIVAAMGLSKQIAMPAGDSPAALYAAEQSLVSTHWVIPLVDLPEIYGLSPRVQDWMPPAVTSSGGWRLGEVWKEPK
jgi:peptide/nickel transport system substrate-binding protein